MIGATSLKSSNKNRKERDNEEKKGEHYKTDKPQLMTMKLL